MVSRTVALLILASLLEGCSVSRSYWDAKVRELCERDGGVTVFERMRLTHEEYRTLGALKVPLPDRSRAGTHLPAYVEYKQTWINDHPSVYRLETTVTRRSDGKVLSRAIDYGRVGDDFIRPFSCHDIGIGNDVYGRTFLVEGR